VPALKETIESVLNSRLSKRLFLIDNSETDVLKNVVIEKQIEYVYINANIGYSKAHNIAIQKAKGLSDYHLVLNPDVNFTTGVLEEIYEFMEKNKEVGQLMPNVLYENGELQKLCNLLPSPADLIGRRFFPENRWFKKLNDRYELNGFDYNTCANIPNLSGCFMFLRSEILDKVKGFDERYFMYMEDVDLTRRIHKVATTLFYPYVSIYHGFKKESYSSRKLLTYHINSALQYFNKWGWLFDNERDHINKRTLKELNL
jgi:GT2 family glycosyltransferase